MPTANNKVAILGIFVADTAFRAARLPIIGETIKGSGFALGPGGKGSNQAVAAARAGGDVTFITRIGTDSFGAMAQEMWRKDQIHPAAIAMTDAPTGAAFIFVNDQTGDNAIIVYPGAALFLTPEDCEAAADHITSASVFMTQLEQPLAAARRGLELAKTANVTTILNPAPAAPLDHAIYPLCDYITPNESEAASLTGLPVTSLDEARTAADWFLAKGVGTALMTLGEKGALLHNAHHSVVIPAIAAGPVVETTGAGDAFNGGFASALARGLSPIDAARFASVVAGISVTRPGAANSMPSREDIERILNQI